MRVGISIYNGINIDKQVELMKKYGINRTFLGAERSDFDKVMKLFSENDIICETIHAPFDKINDMWCEDEELGSNMLNRLKKCVDRCHQYNIPVFIVHLSSGRPMPEINEAGVARFEELFSYAEEKGVIPALENQRYKENLLYFMDRYKSPGFCWDNGHEYGFTKNIRFMDLFGDRLSALHIHDNRCGTDTDDHLLPFDGKIDFSEVAKILADSRYDGTLMLEIGKSVKVDGREVYADLTEEEYFKRAVNSVRKLSDMVEAAREK